MATLLYCSLAAPTWAAPMTLDECIEAALAQSPSTRAAAADVVSARALVRAARAAYVPKLVGHGEYGHSWGFDDTVTDGGRSAALISLEIALLDGGLRSAELEAARARMQSAEAVERQRRANVALAVRTAYLTALHGRTEIGIHHEAAIELQDALSLLERQEARGLIPRNDVLRAESAHESVLGAARAAEASTKAALSELALLSGTTLAAEDLVELAPAALETPSDATIDASPPLADARAQAEAAQRDVDAATSERWGRLGLSGNGGFLGVDPGPTFRQNGGGDFLVGYTVPIFDGGALGARIAAAKAAAVRLEANVDEVRQTIAIALAHVQAEAARAAADREAWQRTVPHAAEGFQLMRARYFGGGNVRLLEVLDALSRNRSRRGSPPSVPVSPTRWRAPQQFQILGAVRMMRAPRRLARRWSRFSPRARRNPRRRRFPSSHPWRCAPSPCAAATSP